jgi:hypothetical protein
MSTNIIKLRLLLQHAEVLTNFSRILDRAANLLTVGQVSNGPENPEITAQELIDLVGADQAKKILAARTAFNTPELLDPKPEPEPKIIYIEVPTTPAIVDAAPAPAEPAAEPALAPAEPAVEPVAPPAPDVTEPTA